MFRKGAVAIITNDKGKVLAFQRRDYQAAYQLPQGGIGKNEDIKETLLRELNEETGIEDITIIKKCNREICYKKPFKKDNNEYEGQCHIYFLCKLNNEWKFKKNNEFISFKWMSFDELLNKLPPFKKDAVKKAFIYFNLI
jgi:putative (di)nucleoside polyphosphate hydrolase